MEIGGFEVLDKLSSGGMGEVYLARQRRAHGFEKLVAIKTIKPELRGTSDIRAMFLDEARLMARFQHPALTQVLDFGEQGDLLYLVMEYVAGVSFRALAAKPPPPIVVTRAMAEICRGLHAAHELRGDAGRPLNVVHRDVSPQNLMLTFDAHVKILDFGIAFMRDRLTPVTEHGSIKGKPTYMAPEQLKGEPIDRRTDVFAAGIVLHELLAGRRLFVGDSAYAVALAIDQQEVPPPSVYAGALPPGLDQVALRALRKAPADRFASASDMAEALEEIVQRSGGETLQHYVARALDHPRRAHEARLSHLLAEDEVTAPLELGRAAGVATAAPRGRPTETATTPERGRTRQPVAAAELPETRPQGATAVGHAASPPRRRPVTGWALALSLLVLAGLGLIALAPWRAAAPTPLQPTGAAPSRQPTLPAPPAPAPAPEEAPPATPTPDAGATAQAPDAAAADAHRAHRRPPPRRRPDRKLLGGDRGSGTLTVVAAPYAIVHLDGRQVGITPIYDLEVAAGRHRITLVRPDTGAARHEREVEVVAGGHVRVQAPPL